MPAINYLSELDRINAKKALGPIIKDMSERELKVALLYVLHGIDIYEAVESARFAIEKKGKGKGCWNQYPVWIG